MRPERILGFLVGLAILGLAMWAASALKGEAAGLPVGTWLAIPLLVVGGTLLNWAYAKPIEKAATTE